ncbi:MAG: helix-turn-helix domain-containing protein [Pseudomonadota bacterium]
MTDALPTKDRLIQAAMRLFRSHGYNGVGVAEILAEAKAPKGSLYHHFPNGKADLAVAAAQKASDEMLRLIAISFAEAESFKGGATTLCHKLAKLFDKTGWDTCPIAATLFEGPNNAPFRAAGQHMYDGWIGEVQDHASRFGLDAAGAEAQSEALFIAIQGAWMLARARQDSDVLRRVPDRL